MTAEVRKLIDQLIPAQGIGTERENQRMELYAEIEKYANTRAVQIARKAVDQERNVPYAHEPERMYQAAVCNRILSRIKSELNSSGVNEDINTTETGGE